MSIKELLIESPVGAVLGVLITLLLIVLCLPDEKGEKMSSDKSILENNKDKNEIKNILFYIAVGVVVSTFGLLIISGNGNNAENSIEKGVYCAQYQYGKYSDRYDWWGGDIKVYQKDIDAGGSTGKCLGIYDKNGVNVTIQYPSKEVMEDWAKYDKQFIQIQGTIKKDWHNNYYMYNPRFLDYN